MKKQILSILFVVMWLTAMSQTVINNPQYAFSTASMVKIEKIELSDTSTVIYCKASGNQGTRFSIPDKTYIQAVGDSEKKYVKSALGVSLNTWNSIGETGEMNYKLIFPAIKNTVGKIDYGEANGGGWSIYDIQIKPSVTASLIPQEIEGNWFNTSTGAWEISFLDSLAIYQSQLWQYETVNFKKGKGTIKLKNKTNTVELKVNADKNGNCTMGKIAGKPQDYTKDPSKLVIKTSGNEKPYELPVFNNTDSATYSGYIKGYSPRYGGKTFIVYVDDLIVGNQNAFMGKISGNGYFSVKLPVYYPHNVWVRSSIYNGSVFMEPGKTLFQLFGSQNYPGAFPFMGESAKVNVDLQNLDKINSFNYYAMRSRILDMKPADYKTFCQNLQKKDVRALDSVMQTKTISVKAYQVKRLEIDYRYFCNIMEYKWNFEGAYREKHRIPREQRTIPVKIDTLTAQYYDFVTNDNANNPLAVLCSGYNSYINRLKYLEITAPSKLVVTTLDIFESLQKSGFEFTAFQKTMFEGLKEVEALRNSPEQKAYQEKYEKPTQEFFRKYQDTLKNLYLQSKPPVNMATTEAYLKGKGVQLTNEEIQLLKAIDENDKTEVSKKIKQFYTTYSDSLNNFHRNNNKAINYIFTQRGKEERLQNLEKKLGIKKGLATDIMYAQDACRSIVEEYTPATDKELERVQQEISMPFIADYIASCNKQTKLKIEANKQKKDYIVNEVPKTEADKLFEGIMEKYKGKVVYVDFWATWCGPCRSGIAQIKPLKEELANENVVFVYITGPSSPENTWSNMIPDIKGEHYRVSNDEWNYLCQKFNISGIPHCMIVGKNGEVINPHLWHMENSALKAELLKRINE